MSGPTFADVINAMIKRQIDDVHVSLPGRIVSYADGRASVEILVKRPYTDDNGERKLAAYPILQNVPVVHSAGGGAALTFPAAAGDTVLLVVPSQSTDRWRASGGVVDPGDDRRHDLSSAVAITGLRSGTVVHPTDCARLGYDEGGAGIEVSRTEIRVGGAGAVPTIKGPDYLSAMSSLLTALTAALGAAPLLPLSPDLVAWEAAVVAFEAASGTALAILAKVV